MGVIKAADVRIEKAAREGAAQTNLAHNHDITPAAIAQAAAAIRTAWDKISAITGEPISIVRWGHIMVHVSAAQALEYLPGKLHIDTRTDEKYPYRLSKYVDGVEFFIVLAEDEAEPYLGRCPR